MFVDFTVFPYPLCNQLRYVQLSNKVYLLLISTAVTWCLKGGSVDACDTI